MMDFLFDVGDVFIDIALVFYALSMMVILIYSLGQVHLLSKFFKGKTIKQTEVPILDEESLPLVTVQLPIYNELYVAERLLNTVVKFDYPKEKLQIQVLDDSTDETADLLQRLVSELQAAEVNVAYLHRHTRIGFKAGALSDALPSAQGEFIAIFDADFIPPRSFLRETIPYFFCDDKIGVVQTRWGHLNTNVSLLTEVQSMSLNAHFSIEQEGRNSAGYFMNFNGTAGVIRKSMIESSGGWQSDTITEDLDLSYRAQLIGWKFKYLSTPSSPAELPEEMASFRSQQFRWAKGAIQTAKKNLMKVWMSSVSEAAKFHATLHLCANVVFVFVLLSGILSVPLVIYKNENPNSEFYFNLLSISMLSFFCTISFYATSFLVASENDNKHVLKKLITTFPAFIAFSMGMSLHNSIAVFEGITGKSSPFIRTPKFGSKLKGQKANWHGKKYVTEKITLLTIIEGLLSIYFCVGIFYSLDFGEISLLPFQCMFATGFGTVCCYSIFQAKILPYINRNSSRVKLSIKQAASAVRGA